MLQAPTRLPSGIFFLYPNCWFDLTQGVVASQQYCFQAPFALLFFVLLFNFGYFLLEFRWWAHNTIYRSCIIKLYTWNLYNIINQCHLNEFNLKTNCLMIICYISGSLLYQSWLKYYSSHGQILMVNDIHYLNVTYIACLHEMLCHGCTLVMGYTSEYTRE